MLNLSNCNDILKSYKYKINNEDLKELRHKEGCSQQSHQGGTHFQGTDLELSRKLIP